MIGPEILDRLLTLATGVVAISFGLGVLLVVGAVLGSVVRLRRMSRSPSAVSGKGPR